MHYIHTCSRRRGSLRAVPPATGRLDDQHVAGSDLDRVAAGHLDGGPVAALDPVVAEGAGPSTGEAVRRDAPVSRQRAHRHGLAEPQAPHGTVPAAPSPAAPAAAPDRETVDQHGKTPL